MGSEMCIRDSTSAVAFVAAHGAFDVFGCAATDASIALRLPIAIAALAIAPGVRAARVTFANATATADIVNSA